MISSIFIVLCSSAAPVYFVNRLAMTELPAKNRTVLTLVHTEHRESVEALSFTINNVIIPFVSFIIIIICTIILVVKLRVKAKWRTMSTSSTQAESISNRDTKVTKMVVIISGLFIFSFIPVCINFIAMSLVPEFSIGGKYENISLVMMGIGFLLESANSSANIFIYYHMSSRYKQAFHQLFCTCSNSFMHFQTNNVNACHI